MYKFVKIRFNHEKESLNDWFFLPTTIEDVELHWEKYSKPDLLASMSFKYENSGDILSSIIEGVCSSESIGSLLDDTKKTSIETLKQRRVDLFRNNKNILLSQGGQCIDIPLELLTITSIKECKNLEYPN